MGILNGPQESDYQLLEAENAKLREELTEADKRVHDLGNECGHLQADIGEVRQCATLKPLPDGYVVLKRVPANEPNKNTDE